MLEISYRGALKPKGEALHLAGGSQERHPKKGVSALDLDSAQGGLENGVEINFPAEGTHRWVESPDLVVNRAGALICWGIGKSEQRTSSTTLEDQEQDLEHGVQGRNPVL